MSTWHLRRFEELSADELYELLALRIRVFVVEQHCPYPDTDGKDKHCHHLFRRDPHGEVMACLRIVAPGISYEEVSIGRVATDERIRRSGVGFELMQRGMKAIADLYGEVPVRISAQSYLQRFYEGLGFRVVSEEYLEDDIPHLEMLYTPQ